MKLHCRRWGEGSRAAVLIHGMMGESRCWWQVGPALAARGYRVVAVDLPGHGHSPSTSNASLDLFVTSVLESVPERPALAIGHSLGGGVLALAAERLDADRAVYVDIPFDPLSWSPPEGAADTVDLDALTAERTAHFEAAKANRTLENLRRLRSWWSEQDMAVEVEATKLFDVGTAVSLEVSGARLPPAPFRPTGSTPSLVIRPEPSDVVSAAQVEELRELGIDVRSVPGAGHSVWYGFLDEFMAALDSWC